MKLHPSGFKSFGSFFFWHKQVSAIVSTTQAIGQRQVSAKPDPSVSTKGLPAAAAVFLGLMAESEEAA